MSKHSRAAIKSIIAQGIKGITETPSGCVINTGEFIQSLKDNPNTLMGTMYRIRNKLPKLYENESSLAGILRKS